MTDHAEPAPLPGLEPPTVPAGDLEQAARRTLGALEHLGDADAGLMQLLVVLGRQLDRAHAARAKGYAVANLAAQFRETSLALAPPEKGGDERDAFTQLLDELNNATDGLPADVRDPS